MRLRAVRLFASRIADAIVEGNQIATEGGVAAAEAAEEAAEAERLKVQQLEQRQSSYLMTTRRSSGEGGAIRIHDICR